MDPMIEEEQYTVMYPVTLALRFLATYGWFLVGGAAMTLYALHKLRPIIQARKQAQEDAEYHKDPDRFNARMLAIERARERQQELLKAASERALEQQKEREERKRQENLQRLEKYGSQGGHKLGTGDEDYLPLSGGASTSSYRPPKRSACSKGGCGR